MLDELIKALDKRLSDSDGLLWSITINRINNDATIQITDDSDGEGKLLYDAYVQTQLGDRDAIEQCAEKILKQLA